MSSQGYNGQITDEVREQLLERWNNRKRPAAGGAAPQRKKGPESYESRKQTIRQTFGQLGYEPDDEDMRVLHRSAKQGETSMPEYLWQRVQGVDPRGQRLTQEAAEEEARLRREARLEGRGEYVEREKKTPRTSTWPWRGDDQ